MIEFNSENIEEVKKNGFVFWSYPNFAPNFFFFGWYLQQE